MTLFSFYCIIFVYNYIKFTNSQNNIFFEIAKLMRIGNLKFKY